MEMHDDLTDLARQSLRQALARSQDDLWVVLETFGWPALAETDEAFAFTALFEELAALPFGSDALDIASVAFLPLPGPASVVWPAGRRLPERPRRARSWRQKGSPCGASEARGGRSWHRSMIVSTSSSRSRWRRTVWWAWPLTPGGGVSGCTVRAGPTSVRGQRWSAELGSRWPVSWWR